MNKKIMYIDMDNVLVDFPSAFSKLDSEALAKYEHKDDIPGIFALMEPMAGALESYKALAAIFDVYILSTAPWENPSAWSDKLHWVKKHLGKSAYKRLILTHHKNLNSGDYLIDDRTKNGASAFEGEFIHFGSDKFPNWDSVLTYLTADAEIAEAPEYPATARNRQSDPLTADKFGSLYGHQSQPRHVTDLIDNLDIYIAEMRRTEDLETIPNHLKMYAWKYFRDVSMDKEALRTFAIFVADRTYRGISNIVKVDNYTRAFFAQVIPFLWDALQDRGLDTFYILNNELPDDLFGVVVELFRLTGVAVVTPYGEHGNLAFEEIAAQIMDYMAPLRNIMYVEKDAGFSYLDQVMGLARESAYLCVFRNKAPDTSEVAVIVPPS